MAKILPKLDGIFVQAVSETAAVNMMYGCSGAGLRCMTFTSSPGFSLMLEGISYMIGAELPGVFVNVMRGGPGLGNIGPEQADIKLACRGLGHGNTHAIVLAPATPQEMLDLTMLAFELSFAYRNPVVILGDGYLGQMTGKVELPKQPREAGPPVVGGVRATPAHRGNLDLLDLPGRGRPRGAQRASQREVRAHRRTRAARRRVSGATTRTSSSSPATPRRRWPKARSRELRARGVRAGLFRPVTLWPFPIDALRPIAGHTRRFVVVEASAGQLEDELRLALSHGAVGQGIVIDSVRRMGGMLPGQREIVERVLALEGAAS